MLFENELTKAICLYLDYGRSSYPRLNPDAVRKTFGLKAGELLRKVEGICSVAIGTSIDEAASLQAIGDKAVEHVHKDYPKVGKRALKALHWYVTYNLK